MFIKIEQPVAKALADIVAHTLKQRGEHHVNRVIATGCIQREQSLKISRKTDWIVSYTRATQSSVPATAQHDAPAPSS